MIQHQILKFMCSYTTFLHLPINIMHYLCLQNIFQFLFPASKLHQRIRRWVKWSSKHLVLFMLTKESELVRAKLSVNSFTFYRLQDGDVSVCINECLTCSLIQVKYFFGSDMILRNANVRSFVCSMKVCLEHTIFIF